MKYKITEEQKQELDDIMKQIGLAHSQVYGIADYVHALIDHYSIIQDMRSGEVEYDNKKYIAAREIVLAVDRKTQVKREAIAYKSPDYSADLAEEFCNSTFTPNTKGNFMLILGDGPGVEEGVAQPSQE